MRVLSGRRSNRNVPVDLNDSLIIRLPFSSSAGGVHPEISHGYDFTAANSPTIVDDGCEFGRADEDYVYHASNEDLQLGSNDITFGCKVKFNSLGVAYYTIAQKGNTNTGPHEEFQMGYRHNPPNSFFYFYVYKNWTPKASTVFIEANTDDEYYFWAKRSIDDDEVSLWVNGSSDTSDGPDFINSADIQFEIGGMSDERDGNRYLDGIVRDFRYWKAVKSDTVRDYLHANA